MGSYSQISEISGIISILCMEVEASKRNNIELEQIFKCWYFKLLLGEIKEGLK